MKIHHLRNATFVIEAGGHRFLIDPMLNDKGKLPPFSFIKYKARRNPTVPLPENAVKLLEKVTCCLITHSQTFGIKALQHTDHLDGKGEALLAREKIPVICQQQDAAYLEKYGINVEMALNYWEPKPFHEGEIIAVPAQHGHGWNHHLMANGAGFYFKLPNEPSIYISGDTVFTKDVERTLNELKPDIAVVAAGSASLDVGPPILMPLEEILLFVQNAPKKVIANHLEALNHCPTTRHQLKEILRENDLLSKTFIPDDGETLIIE